MDAGDLVHDLQALRGGLVATVEDEPVRGNYGRRAEVLLTAPEGRAGGGAAGAQDALGGIVEAQARLRALVAFFFRFGVIIDEPRFDGAVVA